MSFVRNAWYVAGWSRDFGEPLKALEITGQRLVMFREAGGAVKALEDRCPHRLLPLSKGKRIGDTIQCGYHGMTFNGAGQCVRVPGQNVPVHVSTSGEVISAWRWIRNAPPIGFFQKFGGFDGHVDRWHYYDLHLPSTAVIDFGSIDTELNCPEEERGRGVRIFALHFVTPVREDYTIDHWMHLRNTSLGDEDASAQMDAMFKIAFAEDKEILEAVHDSEQQPQRRRPIRVAIDKGPTVYRKRIRDMIASETTQDLGAPVGASFIQHD